MGRPSTKMQTVKATAVDAVSNGMAIVEELHEEMENWADNLDGANMSHLPKYEEVTDARDNLDSAINAVDASDMPEVVQNLQADYTENTKKKLSRADRLSNAVAALESARDVLQNWVDEEGTDENGEDHENKDEVEDYINSLEEVLSELENVSFPGMY